MVGTVFWKRQKTHHTPLFNHSGMPNHTAAIQLCVQKLRILIEDSDQNLKYLGLLAMSQILKTNPKSVQGHKDLVLQCLDDSDESIRLRALDLLYGMVSKKNLMEIVKKLMAHMDKAEGTTYRYVTFWAPGTYVLNFYSPKSCFRILILYLEWTFNSWNLNFHFL